MIMQYVSVFCRHKTTLFVEYSIAYSQLLPVSQHVYKHTLLAQVSIVYLCAHYAKIKQDMN